MNHGKMAEAFKKLKAWQAAYKMVLEIYKITEKFPKHEMYGMTSQIRRAAVSVSANIAEGYGRQHRKEYVQFLSIARGSLGEVETYILLAKDLGYINENVYGQLDGLRQETGRILTGLIRSLNS